LPDLIWHGLILESNHSKVCLLVYPGGIQVSFKLAREISFLIVAAFLALAFNNCSKVAVSDITDPSGSAAKDGGNTVSGDPLNPGVPGDPSTLIATCANAKAKGKLRVANLKSTFADPGKQCSWGVDGNLSILDTFARARVEQREVFQVSSAASKPTICNIVLKSTQVQNFYYDDNVILTLNGYILASTTDFNRHFQSNNGYYVYDWTRLVGQPGQVDKSNSTASQQYCAGKSQGLSSCVFPQTQTTGTAQVQIGEKSFRRSLG
jgi:hypothetical protein